VRTASQKGGGTESFLAAGVTESGAASRVDRWEA
jgi:hypothetical protein